MGQYDVVVSICYLIGTSFLCRIIRQRLNQNKPFRNPNRMQLANDMLNTFELCAHAAENWCVRSLYGKVGYGILLFCRSYHYSMAFPRGTTGNVCASFRRLVQRREWSVFEYITAALLCSGCALFATRVYAPLVWSMQITDTHSTRLVKRLSCQADLGVSILLGVAIEFAYRVGLETFPRIVRRMVQRVLPDLSATSTDRLCLVLVGICDSFAVCTFLETTGMYGNPTNALAQGFFCIGVEPAVFALVYWFAPLAAVFFTVRFIEPQLQRTLDKLD